METEGSLPHSWEATTPLSVPIQNQWISPHSTYWKSILIVSFHLRPSVPSDLFPSDFPTKTLHALFLSSLYAVYFTHFIRLVLFRRKIFGEDYTSYSSSLRSLLQYAVTWVFLSPDILFSNLFNNSNLFSSFNFKNQLLQPYKPTGKIIVLYILILMFSGGQMKAQYPALNYGWHSLTSVCSESLHESSFDLLWLFPSLWTAVTLQTVYYVSLCCEFSGILVT